METTKEKYINPFTDFGFKRLFGEEENKEYEESLKVYRDLQNSLDTAKAEGKAEGKIEGIGIGIDIGKNEEKFDVARNSIKAGLTNDIIKTITGLSDDQINTLRRELAQK